MKKSLIDTLGRTPTIQLQKISAGLPGNVFVKLESFNPGGSVKDRVAFSMISDAEKKGLLNNETIIVEPTSGDTGIGLAMICAFKSYQLKLFMPENMSAERIKLMKSYGAEVILTDADKGMKEAVTKSLEYKNDHKNVFIPMQFSNKANPAIHYYTTGPEIWADMEQNIQVFVTGVGSGGSITGIGVFLKERNNSIEVIAIEPAASPVLSGGKPGAHNIQGIGAGFIPEVLNQNILDRIELIDEKEAAETRERLIREEGISCGYSSGANVAVALRLAAQEKYRNKNIVTLICDTGERYLS